MAIQITIIGLGRVGASVGLALAKIKDQATRIGNDREPSLARKAEKAGAVDKTMINLPSAVKDADVVILAVPVNEVRETIEIIAPDLKPGSVLIDLSAVKSAAMQWAQELLPNEDRYFVSLTPSFNPRYLLETGEDALAPHADLFQNSLMLINTLPGIDESAISLATNLTQILGSTPLFTDTAEADGLIAYSQLLPALVAAALVNASIDQPGWREARKLAGMDFAVATAPVAQADEAKSAGQAALFNAQNTTRMLDQMIVELRQMRDAIAKQDAQVLQERLEHANQGRGQWLQERFANDWEPKGQGPRMPSSGEAIGRLFGLRPKKDKDQK